MQKFFHYRDLTTERLQNMPVLSCEDVFVPYDENGVIVPIYISGKETQPTINPELVEYWHACGVFIPKPDVITIEDQWANVPDDLAYLRATITTTENTVFTWSYIFAVVNKAELLEFIGNYKGVK